MRVIMVRRRNDNKSAINETAPSTITTPTTIITK